MMKCKHCDKGHLMFKGIPINVIELEDIPDDEIWLMQDGTIQCRIVNVGKKPTAVGRLTGGRTKP